MKAPSLRIACAMFLYASPALAWWDEGHFRVAAVAYEQLTPTARAEANRLIKFNPKYSKWVAAIPPPPDESAKDVDRYISIRAAAWPMISRR